MEYKLIAFDMDGTLLNNNNQISNLTKKYLIKLASQGHKIIISSGRPIRGIISYYKELKLNTPIICYNGAYIYPGKENIEEYCFSFSYELSTSVSSFVHIYFLNQHFQWKSDLLFFNSSQKYTYRSYFLPP